MQWIYDDGGRALAGFKGETGDCVCRAISIATGKSYKEIYNLINAYGREEQRRRKCHGKNYRNNHRSSARTGVYTDTLKKIMNFLGWEWHPTMGIGKGCKVHLREEELPKGRIICRVSQHVVVIIDGVIHDTYDSSREGNRCVYGYYMQRSEL